jgi:hypothetical protein
MAMESIHSYNQTQQGMANKIKSKEQKDLFRLIKVSIIALGIIGVSELPALAETKISSNNVQAEQVIIDGDLATIKGLAMQGNIDMSKTQFNLNIPLSQYTDQAFSVDANANINDKNANISMKAAYITPEVSLTNTVTASPSNTTVDTKLQNITTLPGLGKVQTIATVGVGSNQELSGSIGINAQSADKKIKVGFLSDSVGTDANINYAEKPNEGLSVGVDYSSSQNTIQSNVQYKLNQHTAASVSSINGLGEGGYNKIKGEVKTNFGDPKLNFNAGIESDNVQPDSYISTSASYDITPETKISVSTDNMGNHKASINYSSGADKLNTLTMQEIKDRIDKAISDRKRNPSVEIAKN